MEIKTIHISKASYGPNKDKYVAKATMAGNQEGEPYQPEISIPIPADMLSPIVNILAQAVAIQMKAAADMFASDVEASLLSAPIDHVAIEKAPDPAKQPLDTASQ